MNLGKYALFAIFLSVLSSCQASTGTTSDAKVDENSGNITAYMAVLRAFSCKSSRSVFIAAHRGTHKGSRYPENALESLQALYAKGIFFAEIDVARLRDGKLILYHDGTWDRGTTGSGTISSTAWPMAQKLLLKTTTGKITAYRPSEFIEVLKWAKGKMYLEIDFKSSVDEAKVVDVIKSENMLGQVILISYSKSQARRLHKLALNTAISVKITKVGDIKAYEASGIPIDVLAAWTGREPLTKQLVDRLRSKRIPILAANNSVQSHATGLLPDLIVSNYAFNDQKAVALKGRDLKEFQACMQQKNIDN